MYASCVPKIKREMLILLTILTLRNDSSNVEADDLHTFRTFG